jgi:hypothetical protein
VSLALALPVLLAVAVVGLAQPAHAAATITVSTCDESDLDAAVAQANSDNAGDTITFACSGGISLTSTLDITGSMTLDGTGQQVTLGGGRDPSTGQPGVGVLSVASGVTFTLNDLTVADAGVSGLLNNGGTVNITGSTFTDNVSPGGGGLLNRDGGTVNITGSTFNLNRTTSGNGGALNNNGGTVNITGSLFQANFADTVMGSNEGSAIFTKGTMTITNSVFGGQNQGNGTVYALGGTLSVTNTSFEDNYFGGIIDDGGTADIAFSSFRDFPGADLDVEYPGTANVEGSILSNGCTGRAPADQGYNMESGTSCGFTGTGDVQNSSPQLTATGPGNSLVSPQGSPAIDAVPLALCLAADENGTPRPDDASETTCDMGATESDYPPAAATVFSSDDGGSVLGDPVTFTATFTPTDGGGSVAFYADGSATPISGCGAQALTQVTGTTYRATCTTSSLPLGSHAISATYSGDTAYPAITGSLAGGQMVGPPTTSVLTSSANPSVYGQPVTFTAIIAPTDGGGSVAFYLGPAGAGPPISGCARLPLTRLSGLDYTATCTTSSLPVGPGSDHEISASYLAGGALTPQILILAGGQTVDPAPLTADVVGSQAYGSSPVFTVTGYSGLVNGDTPSVVTGSLTGCTTSVGPGAGVGVYAGTISGCSGLASPNYTLSYADAGLTVTPAPLTAQVAGSQTYGGGSPAFTVTGYSGLVNGDTSSVVTGSLTGCTTTVGPGAGVGSYSGTISGCSGLASPNYTLSYADAGLTVTPAPLTADVVGAQPYGGTPVFTVTGYTGLVNGDTGAVVTGTLTGCSTSAGPGAGVGVHTGTISGCSELSSPNYTISYGDAGLTVSPAPLTVQVAGAQTYGGTPVFTVTGYSGLVNGDTGAVVTGTLTGCTTTVGGGAGPGAYTGTISGCSGLASPNYTIGYADAGVTVSPAPLTITASGGSMTYGGTPPVITPTYGGFVNGDGSGSLITAPTCLTTATSASPAGTYPASCTGAADPDYAISYVPGTVTVGQAAQAISFTAPATGVVGKTATLAATGGGSGNPVTFTLDPASGTGVCTVTGTAVTYTAAGSCVIDANQAGTANYTPAPQVTATITVDQAPAFVLDSPPLTATTGLPYDYTFTASGTPAPTYALAPGAPSWLSVNPATGEVTGTPPAGTTTFSYSVTATNRAGTATAGPFTVTVTKPSPNADISAALACPTIMTVGGTGTCTLTVANAGPATATKVAAAIALPAALSELSCTGGCTRYANVYTWTLPSLASGASAAFRITLQASKTGTVLVLAAAASHNPDPKPLNNVATQQITIKH